MTEALAPVSPQDVNDWMEHLGKLPISVAIVLLVAVLLGFVAFLYFRSKDLKQERLADRKSKESRAERYIQTLERINTNLAETSVANRQVVQTVQGLQGSMQAVEVAVRTLVSQNGGKMSVADSQRVIEIELKNVRQAITKILQRSLYHNHYQGREEKVRTNCWKLMTAAIDASAENLEHLKLAIDNDIVFPLGQYAPTGLAEAAGIPTYQLVLDAWAAISELYSDVIEPTAPDARERQVVKLTNASYRIREVVARHVAKIEHKVEDAFGEDDGTHLDLQVILRQVEGVDDIRLDEIGSSTGSYRRLRAAGGSSSKA